MKKQNRYRRTLRWILVLALAGLPALAMARDVPGDRYGQEWDDPENFSDEYKSGDYGRVLSADQGGRILHENPDPTEPPEEEILRNTPVFPGDRVVTRAHQRVEVELAGGSLVRMDDGTELLFQALPDPYAGYRDNTILSLMAGSVQVRTWDLDDNTFRIDTPSASVYLLEDGEFRIDLLSNGETVVRSRRGVAELSADGGSVLVRSGTQAVAYAGGSPSEPTAYSTVASDRFDRWVRSRDEALRARAGAGRSGDYDDEVVYEALPDEVRPYYRELSGSGSWTYADDYGWVWYPAEVEVGWRPYLAGHWAYGPGGYFWVSSEPWGWAPYHYGRWDWLTGFGWCWIPGRVFGGAWVSWSWGSTYVGWAPLNYWNRPVYYGPRFGDWYCGGSWTFIRYNHFRYHNYYHHRVGVDYVYRHGHRGAIVTRPPKVRPRDLARDGGRARAVRHARDNALNRRTGGIRNRDGDVARRTGDGTPRGTNTARRFRDTESRIMDGPRRRTASGADRVRGTERAANPRRTPSAERDGPVARPGTTGDPGRRAARVPRTGSQASPSVMPRPARARDGERRTLSKTGRFGTDRETPATRGRPTTRPQREEPVHRIQNDDTGKRVRDMYRGVTRQNERTRRTEEGRTQRTQERRPARATTPTRTVRPSRPAEQPRSSTRRTTTRKQSQPQARPAPQRRSTPQARPAPQRRSTPQARPAPQRRSAPKARSAPSRSSAPKKSSVSRSSGSRSKPSASRSRSSSGNSRSSRGKRR